MSFTLSQAGMIRHWNRLLRTERDPAARRRMLRSRAINTFGMVMTGAVLVIVLITKFLLGAWIAIAAMAVIYVLMLAIRRHYDRVAARAGARPTSRPVLPSRNHAVVLVSKVHQPTLRALAYAQATRPDTLTAVTVNVDDKDTRAMQAEWERREIAGAADRGRLAVPGDHPADHRLREVRCAADSPRDVVTVFIPEYVVGRWWENLLHNQSALRLKGRLLFEPGVMVTSVPWQLRVQPGQGPGPARRDAEPAGARPAVRAPGRRAGADRPTARPDGP